MFAIFSKLIEEFEDKVRYRMFWDLTATCFDFQFFTVVFILFLYIYLNFLLYFFERLASLLTNPRAVLRVEKGSLRKVSGGSSWSITFVLEHRLATLYCVHAERK